MALFVAAVTLAGAALLSVVPFQWQDEDLVLLGALAGLAVISEALDFAPFANSRISLSVALILVAGIVSGLPGVAVVVTVAVIADSLVHPKPLFKALFNEGALLLAGAAYVAVFEAFSTGYSNKDWPDALAPALLGSALNFAVNSGLVACAIGIETKTNPLGVWNDRFRWLFPHYVIVGVLAVTMAAAYDRWELGGVALLVVPLAMVWFSLRQYVGMASAFRRRFQRA
ncbi:MAG: hypothetical protein Q7R32_09140 [Dehalococcoidia bacterium]|nr:hypothetical protein [Dehalococcoidia bacterium]